MAKKPEPKVITTDTEEGLNVKAPELNNVAFSIIYNGKKKYSVVKIKFAAGSTNSAGAVEVVEDNLDYYEAQHTFKRETINAGLFEIGVDK